MNTGHFYFFNDNYFRDFTDSYLMKNKEKIEEEMHDRPCFYAFQDGHTKIYWMIPFSSKVAKYRSEYEKKIDKYGRCDTIAFGMVLGHEKAFLIQNMCPVTGKYIMSEYFDEKANIPVKLDGVFEKELLKKARKVLMLTRKGSSLIFPDVLKIEEELLRQEN